MSDYLTRLSQRALGVAPAVRPVIAPLFLSGGTGLAGLSATEGRVDDEARIGMGKWPDLGEEAFTPRPTAPTAGAASQTSDPEALPWSRKDSAPPHSSPASRHIDIARPGVESPHDHARHLRDWAGDDSLPTVVQPVPIGAPPAANVVGVAEATRAESTPAPGSGATVAGSSEQRVTLAREIVVRQTEPPEGKRHELDRVAVVPAPVTHKIGQLSQSTLSHANASRLLGQLRALGEGAAPQRRMAEAAVTPTVVKVTIGRIEVRAVHAPAPVAAPVRAREPVRPSVSLADYLAKRHGERT